MYFSAVSPFGLQKPASQNGMEQAMTGSVASDTGMPKPK